MEDRMKFGRKLAYGAGDFGSNYCWTFISSFALIYFTDTALVGAAAVGSLIMVSKILDGVTDVFMGSLIDRTHSKMGKARPWLFWSTFPLMLLLVLLFNVPGGLSATGKIVYIFIIYTLLGAVCYTASNISYNALVSLVTDDPKDRVSMGSIRFIFAVAAAFILSSTTMGLVKGFGDGQRGWTGVSFLYAFIFAAFTMITVFGVREKVNAASGDPQGDTKQKDRVGFGKSMILLGKNRYFVIMLGIFIVNYIGSGISPAIGVYFARDILGNTGLLGILSLAGIIPMMVILPITPKLTGKFGMRKTCLAASIIGILGGLIVFFSGNSVPVLMAGLVIRSLGSAPFIGTMYALVAEIAEYAALKFKVRMDGVIYSCCSVGIKVGSGLGVALVGWLLSAGGYDGSVEVQSEAALQVIRGLYVASPLVIGVLFTLLILPLDVEKANRSLKAAA